MTMDAIAVTQLILYCLISIVGVIGNIATIVAIRGYRALVSTLEQTTLIIITLLSVCDLFVCGFVVPIRFVNTIVGRSWPFENGVLCGLYWHVGYPATFASVWIMLCLALTRLGAVFWPFKYEAWLNKKSVCWSLFLVGHPVLKLPWVISYIPMTVAGLRGTITTMPGNSDPLQLCAVNPKSKHTVIEFKWLMLSVTFLEVFVPLTLGGLLYVLMLVKVCVKHRAKRTSGKVHSTAMVALSKHSQPTAALQHQQQRAAAKQRSAASRQRRLRGVKLMSVAYLAYMACVYPRQIVAGLIRPEPRPRILYAVVDVLFYMSFMITPLVYLLTMGEMRLAYKKMFGQLKKSCSCAKS